MVKLHLELEGDVGEVVLVLRRIGGGDNADGEVRDGAPPALAEERAVGGGHCSGAGDNGNFCSVGARPLDGGAGCRLHGGSGRRGRAGVVARLAGQAKAGIHRNTLWPEDGPFAGGVALVADKGGPRVGEVPAGAGHGAVAADGGQQPAAELFRRSPNLPRWRPICSTRVCRTSCPVACGALDDCVS